MDWHEAIKKWGQQQRLLNQAKTEEENNNLEAAFELYQHAAALGNGDAMVAIGNLYAVKNFRMKETYDFLEHVLKGSTLMPYNLTKKQEPDLKTALEWYIKAAEQDHPDGCFAAGAMLCEGKGCESDVERGLMYLKKADEKGMPSARQVICIYDPTESLYLSDDEYEKLLERFVQAVDSCTLEQFELYSRLKGGTESQQTRLGYTLITRRNLEDPKYQSFKYLFSPEGIPLLPCCARRGAWKSFVRVDLNAFRSDDIYIAFATDISNSFVESSRLTPVGSAVYRSPAFGWLGEEKKSLVLKVDRTCVSQQIQEIAEEFGLLPKEYAEENAAFIVENGEKEYSVEFAVIENGKVHVLYRYTIDGPDEIHSSFEPELISLTIDKYDADTINKETNGVSEECEQQENASKSINCANHCRKNMRLKLINAICDPERSSKFKEMLSGSFDVEEVLNSKFNQIMMTHKFLPPSANRFLASLETDLLVFAYDSSPLSGKFMNMFWKHKDLVKKAIFVIYASNDYFMQNRGLMEQCAEKLQKNYPNEDINNRFYMINSDDECEFDAFINKVDVNSIEMKKPLGQEYYFTHNEKENKLDFKFERLENCVEQINSILSEMPVSSLTIDDNSGCFFKSVQQSDQGEILSDTYGFKSISFKYEQNKNEQMFVYKMDTFVINKNDENCKDFDKAWREVNPNRVMRFFMSVDYANGSEQIGCVVLHHERLSSDTNKISQETVEGAHKRQLGQGYYLTYDMESNMMGGYHPVNIVLKNSNDENCNYRITDKLGNFVNFPGVKKGDWEKELDGKFYATVMFTFWISEFVDGISYVIWILQPDGRYFEDEDGFGGENCSEIELYSAMNTKGEFIYPFTNERIEGCGNCYML